MRKFLKDLQKVLEKHNAEVYYNGNDEFVFKKGNKRFKTHYTNLDIDTIKAILTVYENSCEVCEFYKDCIDLKCVGECFE